MPQAPAPTDEFLTRRLFLVDLLFRRVSVREFIHEAALMLQSPVILTSSTYRVLAMDALGLAVDDPVWKAAEETGYCSAENIHLFETEGITRAVMESREAFLLDSGLAARIPRVLQKITVFGKISAFIGVFQMDHPLDALDLKTTDLLCDILSLLLERDSKTLGLASGMPESILQGLLAGEITSPMLLSDRLQSAAWAPQPPYRCVLITPSARSRTIDNADYLLAHLMDSLRAARVIPVEEGLLLFLSGAAEAALAHAEAVIGRICAAYGLYAGVSPVFDNLLFLPAYHHAAALVRRVARMLQLEDRVVRFESIVFQAMIASLTDEQKKIFIQPEYAILSAYDNDHGTDYCRTLRVYVETGCSVTDTSRKLFIHRNTMNKRLARIEEICGLDVRDGGRLIHFYLSSEYETLREAGL